MIQSTMRMEDVVRKMQGIPCFQSLHHEGEDVVGSLWEIPATFLQEYGHRFGKIIHLRLLSGRLLLVKHIRQSNIQMSSMFKFT
jgi:hypothetical protein